MNAILTLDDVALTSTEVNELAVEQLPALLRQLSALSVPISLTWGAGNRPLTLRGHIISVMQTANWLRLYKSSQQQIHIALSVLADVFIFAPPANDELMLIGHDAQGQRCLSIRCHGQTRLERLCWQKVIHANCQSDGCQYGC